MASKTIEVILPNIPLMVPERAMEAIGLLTRQTMGLTLQDLAGYVSDEAPQGISGHLAQSFGADPATATGGIEVSGGVANDMVVGRIFSSLPYAVVMEEGRRPGHPVSPAGIEAIGLWAQRKLGLDAKDAKRVKYAIANAITRRGIKATHFFERAAQAWQPRSQLAFDTLSVAIVEALAGAGLKEG